MNKIFAFTDKIIDKLIKNKKLNALLKKIVSREMFDYLFFGVLTTVVNLGVMALCEKHFGTGIPLISNAIAWIVAVIFAFVTNKFFVFHSKGMDAKTLSKEFFPFAGARLFSLGVEELGLWIAQFFFHADGKVFEVLSHEISGTMVTKIILSVIVVIMNYVFSKLFIFKNKK